MTINVSKDVESTINAAVRSGQFASADEMIAKLVREYENRVQQPSSSESTAAPGKRKPIWERAAELRGSIPAEEWAKLPVDGASQHDHYIYGTPKRSDR
jgi:Arc/MetJ-type ribon-helix-helix transcriptional regulator